MIAYTLQTWEYGGSTSEMEFDLEIEVMSHFDSYRLHPFIGENDDLRIKKMRILAEDTETGNIWIFLKWQNPDKGLKKGELKKARAYWGTDLE